MGAQAGHVDLLGVRARRLSRVMVARWRSPSCSECRWERRPAAGGCRVMGVWAMREHVGGELHTGAPGGQGGHGGPDEGAQSAVDVAGRGAGGSSGQGRQGPVACPVAARLQRLIAARLGGRAKRSPMTMSRGCRRWRWGRRTHRGWSDRRCYRHPP